MNYIIFLLGLIIGAFISLYTDKVIRGNSISLGDYIEASRDSAINNYSLIRRIFHNTKLKAFIKKNLLKYLIVELLTGSIFFLIYLKFGNSYETIKNIILVVFIEIISIIDLRTMDVYNSISYIATIIGVLNIIIEKVIFHIPISTYILGVAIPCAFLYVVNKFTGGFGEGDIDVFIIIGLFLNGQSSLLILFLSIIIGAIAAITFIALKRLNKDDAMPFVPYIFVALIITLLCGDNIINTYFSIII